jgi:cytochrome c551/c552
MARKLALTVVVLLVLAQLVPVSRTNPPVTGAIDAPPDVQALLRRACADCHTHETVWPWYASVAPVSWLVAHDVDEAREHLNLSTWTDLKPRKRRKAYEEIAEMIEEEEMPLWYYVPLHPQAQLTAAERARLVEWANGELARAGG